ncbi:GntR family transcriptional regulator [Paracoccus yeei]|uniref:GntR family transcriptional regulator n=1 Tax=Paracoccus yeei TaxID=147645 RepID=UPI003BF8BEDD
MSSTALAAIWRVPRRNAAEDEGRVRATIADRAYDDLKLMAMTFRFPPGERINEVTLSERLGISRTPLRVALNRLATEGYLTSLPQKGFYARTLSAEDIQQMFELRSVLEQGEA